MGPLWSQSAAPPSTLVTPHPTPVPPSPTAHPGEVLPLPAHSRVQRYPPHAADLRGLLPSPSPLFRLQNAGLLVGSFRQSLHTRVGHLLQARWGTEVLYKRGNSIYKASRRLLPQGRWLAGPEPSTLAAPRPQTPRSSSTQTPQQSPSWPV